MSFGKAFIVNDSIYRKASTIQKNIVDSTIKDTPQQVIKQQQSPLVVIKPEDYYNYDIIPDTSSYFYYNQTNYPVRHDNAIFHLLETDFIEQEIYDKNAGSLAVTNTQHHIIKENFTLKNDWIVLFLLISFFVIAWIRKTFRNFFHRSIFALVNYRESYKLFEENNNVTTRLNYLMIFNYIIFTSLIIYLWFERNNLSIFNYQKFGLFAGIIGILLLFLILKRFSYKVLGFILNQSDIINEYIYNLTLYSKFTGIFVFPLIIFFTYVSNSTLLNFVQYFILVIYCVGYSMLFIRSLQIINQKRISFFYALIGFISVEVIPLLILVKLFYLKIWIA